MIVWPFLGFWCGTLTSVESSKRCRGEGDGLVKRRKPSALSSLPKSSAGSSLLSTMNVLFANMWSVSVRRARLSQVLGSADLPAPLVGAEDRKEKPSARTFSDSDP